MSIYLTLDPEREVIKRLRRIDGLRELLRDAKAELEIVEQRNPLVSSKAQGIVQEATTAEGVGVTRQWSLTLRKWPYGHG